MSRLGLVEGNKLREITKHGYYPLTNWEDPPSMLEKPNMEPEIGHLEKEIPVLCQISRE